MLQVVPSTSTTTIAPTSASQVTSTILSTIVVAPASASQVSSPPATPSTVATTSTMTTAPSQNAPQSTVEPYQGGAGQYVNDLGVATVLCLIGLGAVLAL